MGAIETRVGYDGTWVEIDLTKQEQDELEGFLRPYLEAGRSPSSKRQVPEMSPDEREEIRRWALGEGYDVASYGRIPKDVLSAHDKAKGIDRTS